MFIPSFWYTRGVNHCCVCYVWLCPFICESNVHVCLQVFLGFLQVLTIFSFSFTNFESINQGGIAGRTRR